MFYRTANGGFGNLADNANFAGMSERNSPSPNGRQPIVKKITGEMNKYANVKGKDNEKFTLAVSK